MLGVTLRYGDRTVAVDVTMNPSQAALQGVIESAQAALGRLSGDYPDDDADTDAELSVTTEVVSGGAPVFGFVNEYWSPEGGDEVEKG